jgi:hypothetical protein
MFYNVTLATGVYREEPLEIQQEEETGSVARSDTPKRETAKQWPDCFTTSDAMRGYGERETTGTAQPPRQSLIKFQRPAKAASHTLLPFCVCV